MWTGELYFFYSNSNIKYVFRHIIEYAATIGYKYEKMLFEDENTIFFYKDKNMYDYHLEHGYNTDLNGMGCFSIEAKRVMMNGKATLFEMNNYSNLKPTEIVLVLNKMPYYVLVLPAPIEVSEFSNNIYSIFREILNKSVK